MQNKNSNILNIAVKNYGECGFCTDPDNQETLSIPWDIWCQWIFISQNMGNKEWGAAFWVKDKKVTRFAIPKQEVTATECEFKEELGGNGMVHSHHDMGAFHSSQDDQHGRNLYEYSIVVSGKSYEATKRVKLPCGAFGYVKVQLRIFDYPKLALDNISEKKTERLFEIPDRPGLQQSEIDAIGCYACIDYKCKSCNFGLGGGFNQLPFCELCEQCGDCQRCEPLLTYLSNYPEDKEKLKHLAGEDALR